MTNQLITTNRFIIRPLLAADAAGIFELDSNPKVHTYLGKKPIKTLAEAENVILLIQQQYKDFGIGRWAIICKETKNFVGWTGLKYVTTAINNHTNYYDLGYRLIEKYWGKGIATETAKPCLTYAFETLNAAAVYGICDVENIASFNVLKKCGLNFIEVFDLEGTPHNWLKLSNEEWRSSV